MRRLLMALLMAGTLAGCGKKEPPAAANDGAATSSTVMAQSLAAGLSEMVFRPATPAERILGTRWRHPEGGYSIQPPAGWTRTPTQTSAALPIRDRVTFRNSVTGDFLDIGIVKGGPAAITPGTMIGLKDTLTKGLRAANQGALLGTDVFRFGQFAAVQTLVNRDHTVLLHLLVFRKPGEFLQVIYGLHETRYRTLARTVEASLASLQWP
jgi:predicted small lipoprotein YifL